MCNLLPLNIKIKLDRARNWGIAFVYVWSGQENNGYLAD